MREKEGEGGGRVGIERFDTHSRSYVSCYAGRSLLCSSREDMNLLHCQSRVVC